MPSDDLLTIHDQPEAEIARLAHLLESLVEAAWLQTGIRAELSALGYVQDGEPRFYGEREVVSYLEKYGVPEWGHRIEV